MDWLTPPWETLDRSQAPIKSSKKTKAQLQKEEQWRKQREEREQQKNKDLDVDTPPRCPQTRRTTNIVESTTSGLVEEGDIGGGQEEDSEDEVPPLAQIPLPKQAKEIIFEIDESIKALKHDLRINRMRAEEQQKWAGSSHSVLKSRDEQEEKDLEEALCRSVEETPLPEELKILLTAESLGTTSIKTQQ